MPAEQGAIGFELGPVQMAAVLRNVVGMPADRLDLLQAVAAGIKAVGTAAHPQAAAAAFQREFALVAGATARHDGSLAEQTFEGGGGRGEAAVEITRLGGELAQAADGNGAGPGRRVAGFGIGIGITVILAGQSLGRSGEGGG